jgi:hypothetical protein
MNSVRELRWPWLLTAGLIMRGVGSAAVGALLGLLVMAMKASLH